MDRRRFLKLGGVVATSCLLPAPALALLSRTQRAERTLALYNIHTGETLRRLYWADGSYLPDALTAINNLLRDHRTGEIKPIDPNLLDQLHAVAGQLDVREPFHIVSGYRSPRTNEMLRRGGHRIAKKSYHLKGRAVDVRLPGVGHDDLRRVARDLHGGGVGYYPDSGFVHLDTGPVRTW